MGVFPGVFLFDQPAKACHVRPLAGGVLLPLYFEDFGGPFKTLVEKTKGVEGMGKLTNDVPEGRGKVHQSAVELMHFNL